MEYNVKLDQFEGPLDLLLHLVNRLEIDVYELSVTQMTDQYLDFIHTMQKLQLDVAGDYLVMAATLLEMKSKMLLPVRDEQREVDFFYEEEDPRQELIRRLVEYRKYKAVTKQLRNQREQTGQMYSKPPDPFIGTQTKRTKDVSPYDLLAALQKMGKRKRLTVPKKTKIEHDEASIQEKMNEIINELKASSRPCFFTAFHDNRDRKQIVTSFLAVLELIKTQQVICLQTYNFTNFELHLMNERVKDDAAKTSY